MGLFRKLFRDNKLDPNSLSQAEALAAIAVAAIAADGYLLEEERQSIFSVMSNLQVFKKYSSRQRLKLLEKLFDLLRQKGAPTLVDSAKDALPPKLRETAFAVAINMVIADGTIVESEREFLRQLEQVLEIPEACACQMIKSMLVKNKT
ncbi:tellurite resistance TerB family protein [Microcoleus sp. FACHB-672]|uniref:tellurite resistance TerB family protein n=1 Tax=Microcoleus sp. FACHB-672 TaxID=2692825 RepID=UPI00168378B7|nr:tellurite resistance TerB family protein [Microcoleus sp. FACHB-672]MBD2043472.1 tellurite resistance TerB family protein [Microcoleus sp. FACHB-672]